MRAVFFFTAAAALFACVGDETVGTVPPGAGVDAGTADAATGDAATSSSGGLNDAGPKSDSGVLEGGTDGGLASNGKLVFLSSQMQAIAALKDATSVCSAELQAHGRGKSFAWIQDANGKSPMLRLQQAYPGPWVLPNGDVVFAKKADITIANGAAKPITETLDHVKIVTGKVWTALDKTGTPIGNQNCGNWTPGAAGNTAGVAVGVVGTSWASDGSLLSCQSLNYVICFED